jgi:DNA (cytosine-5)-methyltransferase 1
MKYLSLFSGIGGFELGIKQAYENYQNREQKPIGQRSERNDIQQSWNSPNSSICGEESEQKQGHRMGEWLCIGFSEIDKYATQIYQSHFNHKNYGDIKTIQADTLPDFDLLVGGFPCQSFSIAGKRMGFNDTRGTMFFEIARILRCKKPQLLLLENVKGLLSHDNGRTFKTIISTLDELGYDLQWQVLNSKNFGVPQNRERVFIIGHLRGTSRPKVFPFTEGGGQNLKYFGGVISAREQWLKDGNSYSRNFSQGQRIYDTDGISQTLAGNAGGQGGKTGLYHISNSSKREMGFKSVSPAVCARDYKDPKFVSTPSQIRRLTPKECMRLQGFPDNWCDGVSDTQKYKCAGNAVTVNVIQAIMEKILF